MTTATAGKKSRSTKPTESDSDVVTHYARDVVAGRQIAGRLVRQACQRHLDDLKRGKKRGLRWSLEHAMHAIEFFPRFLRLAEGEHAGKPFVLQPWQQFIIGSVFGWLGSDGYRRFRRVYLETSKGQGKTPMLGGIGLYCMAFDGEAGAWCYAAAVTREQARVMFDDAAKMVKASPELDRILDVNLNNIAHLESGSFIRPISSEGRGLDAKRVHYASIDEVHEHENSLVCDKLSAGTKGRRQPLVVEATNAGFDRETVCWYHHEYSARILAGVQADDEWFAYICQLDACDGCRSDGKDQPQEGCPRCDDWRDEAVWPKIAPNLDVSLTRKYVRAQVREAIGMPSQANIVKRLNFCIWTQSYTRFFDVEQWVACSRTVPDAELVGAPCFGGLDLAQSEDFCAFVRIWILPDGRVAVRPRFWLPAAALTQHPNRPYAQWRDAKALEVTEGNITDYDLVEREVGALALESNVLAIAFDKKFADPMAQRLTGLGLTMIDCPQGYGLNAALVALHKRVSTGQLCHGGHPILSWMASNMVVRHGKDNEIRADKEMAKEKIDGIVALAMALSRAIVQPVETELGGVIAL